MPGEDRDSALREAGRLATRGIDSVFTVLGENVTRGAEVEAVVAEYTQLLDDIHNRGLRAEISVKPTQLGLSTDPELAVGALRTLSIKAREAGSFVWVDMESSEYLGLTKSVCLEAMEDGGPLGICLQAYLRSSSEDLRELLPFGLRFRFVKGAYAEPASLAFPRRRDVDEAFFDLVTEALRAGAVVAVATHDRALLERIRTWIGLEGVPRERYEFQMLFGIRTGAQEGLAKEGEPVRVLISYGPSWFPWYMRRLAERPANLWFVLKYLFHR
jgi:proline dehydrogenase